MQDNSFVITDGRRLLRVIRPWARLPAGMEFGPVSRLAVAPDGKVIVIQRKDPAVLNPPQPASASGRKGPGGGQGQRPDPDIHR